MTGLSPGYIWLIEAIDDGANDANWIVAGAGDPDTIDISLWTEGTDYCKIEMPQQFRKGFDTGIVVTVGSGGVSFERRAERRAYQVLSRGLPTSRANADLVEKFIMAPRHTSGSSTVYKTYYLIFYFGVNDHVPFTDSDGNRKSYCKGVVLRGEEIWNQSIPSIYTISLQWRSVW